MRRDSDDQKWKALKALVKKRDKNRCRLIRILSIQEVAILKKRAGSQLDKLDSAHVFPVSVYPHMCYIIDNVVLMNRFSHENLDNCRSPVTGEVLSREEVSDWWRRIVGDDVYKRLLDISKKGGSYGGE